MMPIRTDQSQFKTYTEGCLELLITHLTEPWCKAWILTVEAFKQGSPHCSVIARYGRYILVQQRASTRQYVPIR